MRSISDASGFSKRWAWTACMKLSSSRPLMGNGISMPRRLNLYQIIRITWPSIIVRRSYCFDQNRSTYSMQKSLKPVT